MANKQDQKYHELEKEYNDFICNTWVEYADEPDNKLSSDAIKLRDRMRKVVKGKILSERDQYRDTLVYVKNILEKIMKNKPQVNAEMAALLADNALDKINEVIKRGKK